MSNAENNGEEDVGESSRSKMTRKRLPIEINHAGVVWVDLQTAGARLGRRPEAVVQMARKIGAIRKCGFGNIVDLNKLKSVYEAKASRSSNKPDPPGWVSLKTLASRGFSRAGLFVIGVNELEEFAVIDGVECLKEDFDIDAFVLSDEAQARSKARTQSRDRKSRKKEDG